MAELAPGIQMAGNGSSAVQPSEAATVVEQNPLASASETGNVHA